MKIQFRRANIAGGTYFLTVVTYRRQKILTLPNNIVLLRKAFKKVHKKHPFKIDAFVLLPDHFHCIISLPVDNVDYSTRIRLIKSAFSRDCEHNLLPVNSSRQKKKEKAIWQRRFWEHCIKDTNDLNTHIDYIHYNPVKHGLVKSPKNWKYSSFRLYVRKGLLKKDWGATQPILLNKNIGNE